MFNEDIHIGKIILEKITEMSVNRSELARRINKTRQNIDSIVKRKSIDTNLLITISKVLSYDFLSIYIIEKSNPLEERILSMEEKILLLEKTIEDKNLIIKFLQKK